MKAYQSAQLAHRSHNPKKKSRWLSIIIIIACILMLLSFIGATIFWIGLVHDKLSDTLGAIFTALGTIFGFVALVFAIPPFIQYLQEHRAVPSPISPFANSNNHHDQSQFPVQQPISKPMSLDSSKAQSSSANEFELGTSIPQSSPPDQFIARAPEANPKPVDTSKMNENLVQLAFQQKSELVSKLLACQTIKDRNLRKQVVQELSFANSIDRDSNATNKDDVMNVVNRCLDFPDGLQQLVERVGYYEENSLPMKQLRTFVESFS